MIDYEQFSTGFSDVDWETAFLWVVDEGWQRGILLASGDVETYTL